MPRRSTGKALEIIHFFYGTLRHPPLLERLIGRAPELIAARLGGYALREACRHGQGLGFPLLAPAPAPGAWVAGALARLDPAEAEVIAAYELGYEAAECEVEAAQGPVRARVWLPGSGGWEMGEAWDFADWQARWGAIKTEAAGLFAETLREHGAQIANRRYPSLLVAAASRLRAQANPRPAILRRKAAPDDVKIVSKSIGYAGFFAVEDYCLKHRLFAGGESVPLDRAAFMSGDAAVVLPYDPARDRVALIEQFRTGPMARGDANPWLLEAIAGRIDPGETPDEAALREAGEEAGLGIRKLIAAPNFYPSPGAKSEYIYNFIGLCDLSEGAVRPGGVVHEGEDIRPHLVSFDDLMALLDSGEIDNAPLVALALWLARLRPALRQAESGAESGVLGGLGGLGG